MKEIIYFKKYDCGKVRISKGKDFEEAEINMMIGNFKEMDEEYLLTLQDKEDDNI